MKTFIRSFASIVVLAFATLQVSGNGSNIYSGNIVGYVNMRVRPGYNWIANPLNHENREGSVHNNLNTLISAGTNSHVPVGTTATRWNSTLLRFEPFSYYDVETGWSIDYELPPGDGLLLFTPMLFTNTFVGYVLFESQSGDDIEPLKPPVFADGTYFLSSLTPLEPRDFEGIVGRDPRDGEWVLMWDAEVQLSRLTTFREGAWDNGEPLLSIGHAAFYNLGPSFSPDVLDLALVPEPGLRSLLGLALGGIVLVRRFQKRAASIPQSGII